MEEPTLFKAVYKIRPKSYDYCSVCLRTSSERRLVKPRTFKKFIDAIFVECNFSARYQVCFMCERQANMAYKFYKAATFATTVKQFIREYLDRREVGTTVGYESRRFGQILKKKHPEHEHSLKQWDSQLQKIRSSTELLHTEVLIVDSMGTQTLAPGKFRSSTESFSDMYIVPDAPAELMCGLAQFKSQGTETDSVILIDEDEENQQMKKAQHKTGPTLVPIQKLLDQPRIESTRIIFDGFTDQTDPLTLTPSIGQLSATSAGPTTTAPPVTQFVTTIPAGHLQLATSTNGLQTTNKIVTPSSVVNANENYILHPIVLDKDGNLTVPSLGTTLGPNYMQMPQITSNNVLQMNSIDTGTINMVNNNIFQFPQSASNANLSQVSAENMRLNVQIPNSNNNFNIQTVANNSFNNQLPQQNILNTKPPNQVLQIQLVDKTNPNSNVKILPVTKKSSTTSNADHLKQINDLANEIKSEVENYNTDKTTTVNKQSTVSNNFGIKRPGADRHPVIQDVHSVDKKIKIDPTERCEARRKTDRIDWEDKIPMDVISFVDAVDPNFNQLMKTPPAPARAQQPVVSQARSLATHETQNSNQNVNHIIDLC